MERIQLQAVLSIVFIILCSVKPKADPKVYSNLFFLQKSMQTSLFLFLRDRTLISLFPLDRTHRGGTEVPG